MKFRKDEKVMYRLWQLENQYLDTLDRQSTLNVVVSYLNERGDSLFVEDKEFMSTLDELIEDKELMPMLDDLIEDCNSVYMNEAERKKEKEELSSISSLVASEPSPLHSLLTEKILNLVQLQGYTLGLSRLLDKNKLTEREYYTYVTELEKNCVGYGSTEMSTNPYFKTISIKDCEIGKLRLNYGEFKRGEVGIANVVSHVEGMEIPRWFVTLDDYKYIQLIENEEVWMSITPNEIETMKKPIEEAKGDVLVLGCGLGYYAYMVSLKEEVRSVTIIEKNKDIISLFETEILPQFDTKNKIKIIHEDAIDYMNNLEDKVYEYCFADLWYSCLDFELYWCLKEINTKFKKMRIHYWIEESILLHLYSVYRDYIRTYINAYAMGITYEEQKQNGFRGKIVDKSYVQMLEKFEKSFESIQVNTVDDYRYYCSFDTFKKFINNPLKVPKTKKNK